MRYPLLSADYIYIFIYIYKLSYLKLLQHVCFQFKLLLLVNFILLTPKIKMS